MGPLYVKDNIAYKSLCRLARLTALTCCLWPLSSAAVAGSLYLPLQLAPEIEARIERLFVLANVPIIKRPIPIKEVQRAIELAGDRDPALVNSVRLYLERYAPRANITHFSAYGSYSEGDAVVLPNKRGIDTNSEYFVSLAGHSILTDWLAVNYAGMVGERDNQRKSDFYDGHFLSIGHDYVQVDIGFRPHWFGPFQESDMLISTQAGSMPGVTVSNVVPLPLFNLRYEVFLAQMSESDQIRSRDRETVVTGRPKLFGMHLSAEPLPGIAIGINRLMQYGGGDRSESASDLAQAFFNPKANDNIGASEGRDFGNQLSSITTRYTFSGKFPASVYMEYAGEDTSASSGIHFGNSALMFGLHLPKLGQDLDLSYEFAQWQNAWYTNGNYNFGEQAAYPGLSNYGAILGHWGANYREPLHAIGAEAHMLKLIWDIRPGSALTSVYRQVDNEALSAADVARGYQQAQELSLEYSHAWGKFIVGMKTLFGEDIFGESYGTVSGFIRW